MLTEYENVATDYVSPMFALMQDYRTYHGIFFMFCFIATWPESPGCFVVVSTNTMYIFVLLKGVQSFSHHNKTILSTDLCIIHF